MRNESQCSGLVDSRWRTGAGRAAAQGLLVALLAAAALMLAACATSREARPETSAGSLAQPRSEDGYRAMTFNIRYDNPGDGENAWPKRRGMVAGLIKFHAPDLLGLQEVLKSQLDALAADMPDYRFVGVGRDDGAEAGEYSPVAYRADRFRLLEHGTFWLSPTPDRPSRGWDAALPRIASWARLEDLATGKTLLAVSTHWDHRGQEARTQSGLLLREWVSARAETADAVVLLGDLNVTSTAAGFRALTDDGSPLKDARAASETQPFGPPGTATGFDIMRADAAAIDHVLVSRALRVLGYAVLTQHEAGRLPSDHYPVLADLSF